MALTSVTTEGRAQLAQGTPPTSGFYLDGGVGAGLRGRQEALGEPVTGLPLALYTAFGYERGLTPRWSARIAAGGLRVWRRGLAGDAPFRARAWRVAAVAQAGFRASGPLTLYGGVEARNGRDVRDFDRRLDDNVRLRVRLDAVYAICPRVDVTAALSTTLASERDARLLVDPGTLIGVGLRYRLRRAPSPPTSRT